MATAALKRGLWLLGVVLATAVLVGLALHGERQSALQGPPEPRGIARALSMESIRTIEVNAGALSWRFARTADGWTTAGVDTAVPADFSERLNTALALMHRTVPEDHITVDLSDASRAAQFGLTPPAMLVRLVAEDGELVAEFGGRNPLGLSTYVRVEPGAELLLLPSYVLESWQSVVGHSG